jgi:two-component system OmpR family sensor kinase
MFAKSIRLRFQLWLAFLLVAILSGFGFTAFQLYRASQIKQIDTELQKRLGTLLVDLRESGPGGPGGGRGRGMRRGGPPEDWERDGGPEGRRGMRPDGMRGGPPDGRRPPPWEEFDGPPPQMYGPEPEFRGPPFLPREIRLSARTQTLFDDMETNSFYFVIWSPGGNIIKQSTNAPAKLAQPTRPGKDTTAQIVERDGRREIFQFTERGGSILAGRPIGDLQNAARRFALLLLAAGGGVLGLGLGGGWILATRALRPVQNISAAAGRISGGNLSERINVEDTDSELGQLANLLNSTFGRLEAAFAQQKQFTADAAHELRTPLAVLISETQTALARPRSAEEYRETVEACLETAQQMRGLTHSLLELARLDAGAEAFEKKPFDLAETTQHCIHLLEPLARERYIQIHSEIEPTTIDGDPERISQVITNLISNAIYYNKDHGQIHVTLKDRTLTVSDTGHGIAEADLPHIFERFYRADKSRSRSSGRSGLGLAISKAILDAHNAQVKVTSRPGEGTAFTIQF